MQTHPLLFSFCPVLEKERVFGKMLEEAGKRKIRGRSEEVLLAFCEKGPDLERRRALFWSCEMRAEGSQWLDPSA